MAAPHADLGGGDVLLRIEAQRHATARIIRRRLSRELLVGARCGSSRNRRICQEVSDQARAQLAPWLIQQLLTDA